jgi:hypothetical protein
VGSGSDEWGVVRFDGECCIGFRSCSECGRSSQHEGVQDRRQFQNVKSFVVNKISAG